MAGIWGVEWWANDCGSFLGSGVVGKSVSAMLRFSHVYLQLTESSCCNLAIVAFANELTFLLISNP